MKRRLGAVVAVLAVVACAGTKPTPPPPVSGELVGQYVSMWVQSDDETLPIFTIEGQPYLLGEQGKGYQLGLANTTDTRLEVVVAVDGRDAITGAPANYVTQRGYVLAAGEQLLVEGFRRSLEELQPFAFSNPSAYRPTAQPIAPSDGVIALAIFAPKAGAEGEAAQPNATGALLLPDEDSSLPVDSRYSKAIFVPFERAEPATPKEKLIMYYDNKEGLHWRGAIPKSQIDQSTAPAPSPFPGLCADASSSTGTKVPL